MVPAGVEPSSSAKEGRSIEIFELAGQLGLEEWLEQRNNLTLPTPQGSAPQMTNRNIALQALTPPQYDYLIKYLFYFLGGNIPYIIYIYIYL